jgi:hypothetical protein
VWNKNNGKINVTGFDPADPADGANVRHVSGWIHRVDPATRVEVELFASREGEGCAQHLHRPEGIVLTMVLSMSPLSRRTEWVAI